MDALTTYRAWRMPSGHVDWFEPGMADPDDGVRLVLMFDDECVSSLLATTGVLVFDTDPRTPYADLVARLESEVGLWSDDLEREIGCRRGNPPPATLGIEYHTARARGERTSVRDYVKARARRMTDEVAREG